MDLLKIGRGSYFLRGFTHIGQAEFEGVTCASPSMFVSLFASHTSPAPGNCHAQPVRGHRARPTCHDGCRALVVTTTPASGCIQGKLGRPTIFDIMTLNFVFCQAIQWTFASFGWDATQHPSDQLECGSTSSDATHWITRPSPGVVGPDGS